MAAQRANVPEGYWIWVSIHEKSLILYKGVQVQKRYGIATGTYHTPSPIGVYRISHRFSGDLGGFGFGFGGFGDIFEDLFGFGTRTAARQGPRRGADLRYDLQITFEEAVFGTLETIPDPRERQADHLFGIKRHLCTGHAGLPLQTEYKGWQLDNSPPDRHRLDYGRGLAITGGEPKT